MRAWPIISARTRMRSSHLTPHRSCLTLTGVTLRMLSQQWPEHAENTTAGSSSSSQYIFLNDTLVAPIWETQTNLTTRSVWVPPGDWEDAWDGSTGACGYNRPCAQQYVGTSQSCMVISGRLIVHAPVQSLARRQSQRVSHTRSR